MRRNGTRHFKLRATPQMGRSCVFQDKMLGEIVATGSTTVVDGRGYLVYDQPINIWVVVIYVHWVIGLADRYKSLAMVTVNRYDVLILF